MSGPLNALSARLRPAGDEFPLGVHLLVADRCNHACVHCYQVHGQKGEMSLAEIEQLLADLAERGVLFLELSGGESTLRHDLPEILRAARRHHFAITLLTNGYDVSPEVLEAIVATGVWRVRVSVYSDRPAEHDAVTRVPGSFARTVATARSLRSRGVRVELVSIRTSHCTASPDALLAFAAALDCPLETSVGLTAREDGDLAPLQVAPGHDELQRFFHANDPADVDLPRAEEKLDERPCGACSSAITIQSDGSVRPCTHIPTELARAVGGNIAEIANEPAFKLVSGLRWRDVHGCRDCALLPGCSRCHGSAAFERGDVLGPQPSACRTAIGRHEARFGPLVRAEVEGMPGRDRDVGPFAIVGDVLTPIPDRVTERDEAIAAEFPWVRPSKSDLVARVGMVPVSRLMKKARDGSRTAG
jgi:radical SAM protein with 4Fe4S-binding SPASM domain